MTKEEYNKKLKEIAKLEKEFFKFFINLFVEYPALKTERFPQKSLSKIFDKHSFFKEILIFFKTRKFCMTKAEELFKEINDIKNEFYKHNYNKFLEIKEGEFDGMTTLKLLQISKKSYKEDLGVCSVYNAVSVFLRDYFHNYYDCE